MRLRIFGIFIAALVFFGCEGQQLGAREKGALGGGAIGAGLGAIVGSATGNTGAGIAIGSAFGAISGGLIGNEVDNQNAQLSEREKVLADQDLQLEKNRKLIEELKSRGTDARLTSRGVVVNLPDVLFEFNKADLTAEARRTAQQIAEVISKGSDRHISVEGHTDSIGTMEYNQRLSESRARSVAAELTADGVSRGRVSVRGFGETKSIASNSTASGRQRNRRVEVVIEN